MDSSEPPNSPSPSPSPSRTGSGSPDGSIVDSEPDLGGYVGASASSVGNNTPELPPQGGDGSKDKGKKISTEDDVVENITDQSMPRKRYQSESSKGKEKDQDTTSSEEEITRLEGIIDNYYKNGTHPIPELSSVRQFTNDWIEEHGSYANTLLLNIKMLELQAIILEIEIIRAIQNQNEDSYEQSGDDRGDMKGTDQDLSERETDEETNSQDSTSWSSETSDGSGTKKSTDSSSDYSFESKNDDGSDTNNSTDPSSDNSSESKTDDGSDTKRSSSTGSKGSSSETETDDSFDSKDYLSICLEQNLNAQRKQSTRNVADVTNSYITTRFGMLILIMMALVITMRRSRQVYHRKG